MPPTRRLTVLQDTSADEQRPAWQWRIIAPFFVLLIWAPLAMVAAWMGKSAARALLGGGTDHEVALDAVGPGLRALVWIGSVGPAVLSFGFSCWASGALVGRFGAGMSARDTAGAAAIVALGTWVLLDLAKGSAATYLAALAVLLPVGLVAGWLGGRFGLARRRAAALRPAPPAEHV